MSVGRKDGCLLTLRLAGNGGRKEEGGMDHGVVVANWPPLNTAGHLGRRICGDVEVGERIGLMDDATITCNWEVCEKRGERSLFLRGARSVGTV